MNSQANAEFLKRLIATFLIEAREHVQALGSGLLELQAGGSREAQLPQVETLFREAHSLKGAARAVNASEVEQLCQTIEHTFGAVKAGKQVLSAEVIEELHRAVTSLGQRVDALGGAGAAPAVPATPAPVSAVPAAPVAPAPITPTPVPVAPAAAEVMRSSPEPQPPSPAPAAEPAPRPAAGAGRSEAGDTVRIATR